MAARSRSSREILAGEAPGAEHAANEAAAQAPAAAETPASMNQRRLRKDGQAIEDAHGIHGVIAFRRVLLCWVQAACPGGIEHSRGALHRMKSLRLSIGAFASALVLASAGCGGVPGPATASEGSLSLAQQATSATLGIAGRFTGSADDTARGHGGVLVDLAQAGNAPGGSIHETFGTHRRSSVVALHATSAGDVSGTAVMLLERQPCSFAVTGHYDASTLVLRAKYKAFHNCGNESGVITVKQQCYYVVSPNGAVPDTMHPRTVPKQC
jgi:hypothetical protein